MTLLTLSFLAGLISGYLACHAAHYLHRNTPKYDPGKEGHE